MSAPIPVSPPATAVQSVQLTPGIVRALRAVARRDLWTRCAEFPVRAGIILPTLFLLQALLDWIVDLRWQTRAYLAAGDAAVVLGLFVLHVARPCRRRLDTRAATLLVERKLPQFRTSLISAVELTANPTAAPALVQVLVRQVDEMTAGTDIVRRVIPVAALKKRIWTAIFVVLAVGAAFWLGRPKSLVFARRVLLSRVAYPSRTTVRSISGNAIVPAGSDFEAMARAEGVLPKTGLLIVAYDDGRVETVPVNASTPATDTFAYTLKNVRQPFRYHFELDDGRGEPYRVATRTPLTYTLTHLTQTYPSYTRLPRTEMSTGSLTVMAGGRLLIEAQASQPLRSATLSFIGTQEKNVSMTLREKDNNVAFYDLALPKEGLTSFSIHLVGAGGDSSENDPVHRLDFTADSPPAVVIKTPHDDKFTVLPNDKLPISFTAHDDFGLTKIELVYEIFHMGTEGIIAPSEKGRIPLEDFTPDANGVRGFTWDLGRLIPSLSIGFSGNFWIEAADNDAVFGAKTGQSSHRNFTVVSEDAKKEELLDALSKQAAEIEHLYDLQHKLNTRTDATVRGQDTKP